jgi:hypothetical protein
LGEGQRRRLGLPNKNTIDLQWEMRPQLQCKALCGRGKSHPRRNNGKQWKKQCAEQWKQPEIQAERLRPVATPEGRRRRCRFGLRLCAPAKSNARPKLWLQTRECHSALTAMHGWHQKSKPDLIYPRYSRQTPLTPSLNHGWPSGSRPV